MSRQKPIDAFEGEYRFLSNFWSCNIKYQGITYPSVEHAFQACKTLSKKQRIKISKLPHAFEAKRVGRQLKLRDDWETHKEVIMYQLLKKKFRIPHLRQRLLNTGNAKLIEGNWWSDTYWGVWNGKGKNRLGILLMKVRNSLR